MSVLESGVGLTDTANEDDTSKKVASLPTSGYSRMSKREGGGSFAGRAANRCCCSAAKMTRLRVFLA